MSAMARSSPGPSSWGSTTQCHISEPPWSWRQRTTESSPTSLKLKQKPGVKARRRNRFILISQCELSIFPIALGREDHSITAFSRFPKGRDLRRAIASAAWGWQPSVAAGKRLLSSVALLSNVPAPDGCALIGSGEDNLKSGTTCPLITSKKPRIDCEALRWLHDPAAYSRLTR